MKWPKRSKKDPTLKCPISWCGRQFKTIEKYRKHVKKAHGG